MVVCNRSLPGQGEGCLRKLWMRQGRKRGAGLELGGQRGADEECVFYPLRVSEQCKKTHVASLKTSFKHLFVRCNSES